MPRTFKEVNGRKVICGSNPTSPGQAVSAGMLRYLAVEFGQDLEPGQVTEQMLRVLGMKFNILKAWRVLRGETCQQVGDACGVHKRVVNCFENWGLDERYKDEQFKVLSYYGLDEINSGARFSFKTKPGEGKDVGN